MTSLFLQEIAALEAHKALLTERCHAAFEQHNRLEEAACALRQAVRDQDDTLAIDHDNLARDRHCSSVTFKPDPCETVSKYALFFRRDLKIFLHFQRLSGQCMT